MKIFYDQQEVDALKERNALLSRELTFTERRLADRTEECNGLRETIKEQEMEIGKLQRTLDDVCARLVDTLGCTEHGRYLHEFAERRLCEAGSRFTVPASQ